MRILALLLKSSYFSLLIYLSLSFSVSSYNFIKLPSRHSTFYIKPIITPQCFLVHVVTMPFKPFFCIYYEKFSCGFYVSFFFSLFYLFAPSTIHILHVDLSNKIFTLSCRLWWKLKKCRQGSFCYHSNFHCIFPSITSPT